MDQAIDHLPGIITIHDNICIYGHTPEEHDQHLLKLMQATKQYGIMFNSAKCWIRQPQIAFLWHSIHCPGHVTRPFKIQAFQDLPFLGSQAKLLSFLGLINYLQPFIPSLSSKTMFLQKQLAKWDWNPSNSLPASQSWDLPDPAQCNPGVLWQI